MRACRLLIVALASLLLAAPADAAITRGWTPTQSMSVGAGPGRQRRPRRRARPRRRRAARSGRDHQQRRDLGPGDGHLVPDRLDDPGALRPQPGQAAQRQGAGRGRQRRWESAGQRRALRPGDRSLEGVGAMPSPHHQGEAVLLANGDVLVAGGGRQRTARPSPARPRPSTRAQRPGLGRHGARSPQMMPRWCAPATWSCSPAATA